MHSYSHPHPNFTIRLVVCKIQRQLNEKHIVSQEKLEGSRGHPASLGRASESTGAWGRRPVAPLPTPTPQPPSSLPYNRVPRVCLPFWGARGGGSFGSQMWNSSLWKGGELREKEEEWPLESNR